MPAPEGLETRSLGMVPEAVRATMARERGPDRSRSWFRKEKMGPRGLGVRWK